MNSININMKKVSFIQRPFLYGAIPTWMPLQLNSVPNYFISQFYCKTKGGIKLNVIGQTYWLANCEYGVLSGSFDKYSSALVSTDWSLPRLCILSFSIIIYNHTGIAININTLHNTRPNLAVSVDAGKHTCPLCLWPRRKSSRGSKQSLLRNMIEDKCLLRNCTPFPIDDDRFGRGTETLNGSKSSSRMYGSLNLQ